MNLKQRLQIRALVSLIMSVLERIVNMIVKFSPKKTDEPKPAPIDKKRRPLKKIVDTIDDIVPMPWRDKNE